MDAGRFVKGTLLGGVAVLATGAAIFALGPLRDFYVYAKSAGAATNVAREQPLLWAVVLGALSYGALVTLAIGGRAGSPTIATGVGIGAAVGFLLWCTANFMFHGVSHVGNLPARSSIR